MPPTLGFVALPPSAFPTVEPTYETRPEIEMPGAGEDIVAQCELILLLMLLKLSLTNFTLTLR